MVLQIIFSVIFSIWQWEKYCSSECHQNTTTNVRGKNCNLEVAEKLGKKACVPSLEHGGGRRATKTGLSIMKFPANVASRRPLGPKTLRIGL